MSAQNLHPTTTFQSALPYGIATSATAIAGGTLCLLGTATAAKVLGIALGVIGVYTFIGVIACAFSNMDNPEKFRAEINQCIVTTAGIAIISVMNKIAETTIDALIDRFIYGSPAQRIRIS